MDTETVVVEVLPLRQILRFQAVAFQITLSSTVTTHGFLGCLVSCGCPERNQCPQSAPWTSFNTKATKFCFSIHSYSFMTEAKQILDARIDGSRPQLPTVISAKRKPFMLMGGPQAHINSKPAQIVNECAGFQLRHRWTYNRQSWSLR
jgi:hypothetical protein